MNLTKLEAVLVIAELGSMRQAAERLHCSQPALSQILKSVERDLGLEIFERRRSGLELTTGADRLLREIRIIVEQGKRLQTVAQQLAQGMTDRLDLMAVDSACETVVPPFLMQWRSQYPSISLHLQSAKPSTQLRALLAKEIDAGLLRQPIDIDGVITHPVMTEDLLIAIPSQWQDDELADRPLIKFPRHHGPGIVEQVSKALTSWAIDVKEHIEVDDMTSLLALVAGGCGWALVPESLQNRHGSCINYRPLPEAARLTSQIELAIAVRADDDRPILDDIVDTLRQATVTYRKHQATISADA